MKKTKKIEPEKKSAEKFSEIEKFAMLGRSGCGKSYLGKTIQEHYKRKIIIDSLQEYETTKEVIVCNDLITFAKNLTALFNSKEFTVLYRFNLNLQDDERENEFNEICKLVFHFGNVLLVVEEIHLFSSPQFLPLWLKNIVLMGRHKAVSTMFTSQRAGETNKTLLSMSTKVFCGQIIDKNDANYIANFINEDAKKLSTLPDRTFLEYRSSDPANVRTIKNDYYKV